MPETLVGEHIIGTLEEAEPCTRRRFLSYASGVLCAGMAAALGAPLARFFVGNAFAPGGERWLTLGPVAGVRPGTPQLFHSSYTDRDGWRQTTRRTTVYALTENGRDYIVLSTACTHLGCPVHWDEQAQQFLCPCHNGAYSKEGKVVAGPPPRALAQLEHKIERGLLSIRVGDS